MDNFTSRFRAVLFDFDGTLADSFQAIAASVNYVRQQRNLPPLPEPDVTKHVGLGPGHLLSETVGIGNPEENEKLYRQHHPSVMRTHTHLLPGAKETLELLNTRSIKLAICSNKPVIYTRELLRDLDIQSLFDNVFGPGNIRQPKPHPEMLLTAMKALDVLSEETLYIGDMTIDIETGRAAGVEVWAVSTGSHPREKLEQAQPDRLLTELSEIPSLMWGER